MAPWALLEGLDGKADLDRNGVITASGLAAFVSPVVAPFSRQTPVMGNLIGSEGGSSKAFAPKRRNWRRWNTMAPQKRSHLKPAYDLDREARGLYREKKYPQAAKALEEAVTLKPNDPVLLNNLGFVYFQMERYTHGNIAYACLKLGRRAEAKTHFERYLELFPNSPTAPEVRQALAGCEFSP